MTKGTDNILEELFQVENVNDEHPQVDIISDELLQDMITKTLMASKFIEAFRYAVMRKGGGRMLSSKAQAMRQETHRHLSL